MERNEKAVTPLLAEHLKARSRGRTKNPALYYGTQILHYTYFIQLVLILLHLTLNTAEESPLRPGRWT